MKKYILSSLILIQLTSCVQYYSNEHKLEAINTCGCMELRQANRRSDIPQEVQFIYDDEDYKECVLDAIIKGIDVKGEEFTKEIEDQCPLMTKAQERYIDAL